MAFVVYLLFRQLRKRQAKSIVLGADIDCINCIIWYTFLNNKIVALIVLWKRKLSGNNKKYWTFQSSLPTKSCTSKTGLPDFYKMIVRVLKIYFQKSEAKAINYRDYRNFSNEKFRMQFARKIFELGQNSNIVCYGSFLSICQRALDSRAS